MIQLFLLKKYIKVSYLIYMSIECIKNKRHNFASIKSVVLPSRYFFINVSLQMGINKAFSQSADLRNILQSSEDLKISQIFHKTSIVVNEKGTEAAAATAMKVVAYCMPPEFIADHPFIYFIWNKMNILFAGAFITA